MAPNYESLLRENRYKRSCFVPDLDIHFVQKEVSDGETQRCHERCQKETIKIHSGKKEGQAGKKKQISRAASECQG